jgi:hypothetical protein
MMAQMYRPAWRSGRLNPPRTAESWRTDGRIVLFGAFGAGPDLRIPGESAEPQVRRQQLLRVWEQVATAKDSPDGLAFQGPVTSQLAKGTHMYETPTITEVGTLRDLTLGQGFAGNDDHLQFTVFGYTVNIAYGHS